MSNETTNSTTVEKIGSLILLSLIGWFIFFLFDDSCERSGCENDGIGWTNSVSVLDKGLADGGCPFIPCHPVGSIKGTGYCSRECALAD